MFRKDRVIEGGWRQVLFCRRATQKWEKSSVDIFLKDISIQTWMSRRTYRLITKNCSAFQCSVEVAVVHTRGGMNRCRETFIERGENSRRGECKVRFIHFFNLYFSGFETISWLYLETGCFWKFSRNWFKSIKRTTWYEKEALWIHDADNEPQIFMRCKDSSRG